jgi:hypothetical protein
MDRVGKDGVVTVEEGKSLNTEVDLVEVCSLTRVIVRLTSLRMPKLWSACSKIHLS